MSVDDDDQSDVDLGDVVDGVPIRFIFAVQRLIEAAYVIWPDPDDAPPTLREPLGEIADILHDERERIARDRGTNDDD